VERLGITEFAGEWVSRLKQIEVGLDMITDHAEDEFLSLGRMFGDFHRRARMISETSADVAGKMTGAEIVGAIDGLNELMEKMEAYLKRSKTEARGRINSLREVLNLMNEVYGHLEDFHSIAGGLRSLSITGMAQNALLITKHGEFKILLDDIRTLSGSMSSKSETIDTRMKSQECLIEQTISGFLGFEKRQMKKTRTILDNTMNVICSLTAQYGLSKTAAMDIAVRSAAISRNTGEIVTSIQFHDITRQQFESIKNALKNVYGYCHRTSSARFLSDSGHAAAVSAGIEDFCEHQAVQLSQVRDTFMNAIQEITGNLGQIALNVASISNDAQKIVGSDRTNNEAFLSRIEGTLSDALSALNEHATARRELAAALLSIVAAEAEISEYIVAIEEITEDVELIAFNAEIKSSQIGTEGTAFVVLAGHIQKLSVETCAKIETVSEMLKIITSTSGALAAGIDSELEGSFRELEAISHDLAILISALSGLNRNILTTFQDIDKADGALSEDIGQVMKSIRIHTTVDTVVNTAVSGLREISSHARMLLPAGRERDREWSRNIIGWSYKRSGNLPSPGHDAAGGTGGAETGVEFY
jgi:ribosomal protein S13